MPAVVTVFPARPTAAFRELARFIEAHRSCGTLTIHAPDCDSAIGFLIVLDCECRELLMRWITVEAAFKDVIDSRWPATLN